MKGNIRFFKWFVSYKDSLFVAINVLIFSLLRIPSLIEPYWYGDEGIYQVIGMALNRGRLLYGEIWDNKPPLLYIIYAFFDGDLFYVRFASLVVGVVSIIFFFLLAKKLFKSFYAYYIATIFYSVVFAIPTFEGNIANAENFMLLPIITSFYFVFASKLIDRSKYIISGILLSLAFLIKIVAIFDVAALIIIIFGLRNFDNLTLNKKYLGDLFKKLLDLLKKESILIVSFITPIILVSLYFFINGAFYDFIRAFFVQNISYVGYGNDFIFPNGFLFLKLFILTVSIVLIIKYRKNIGENGLIIFIWLAFSIFNVFFSQRPYTHYILVALPAFSLLIGYLIDNKKLLKITIPVVIIVVIIIWQTFKPNIAKNIPYYTNYLTFVTENKSTENYLSFFDRNTPRDYAIASFIKSKTASNENVFIWGDSGQIYALSDKLPPGRYIVSYHITFYPDAISETKKDIDRVKPKYIIQIKDSDDVNNFLDNYEIRYKMDGVLIYERRS